MDLAIVDPLMPVVEQASVMAKACEDIGFFRVPVSAIDRSVADTAWNAATEFFDLPDDDKRLVGFPEPGYPYGYSAYRGKRWPDRSTTADRPPPI